MSVALRKSTVAALCVGALAFSPPAGGELPPYDAADTAPPPPVRGACLDTQDCLFGETCVASRCTACAGSVPVTCGSDPECGPACLGLYCRDGRCVPTAGERGDSIDGGHRPVTLTNGSRTLMATERRPATPEGVQPERSGARCDARVQRAGPPWKLSVVWVACVVLARRRVRARAASVAWARRRA